MTYKSIIEKMCEKEARKTLLDNVECIYGVDFGVVEFDEKGNYTKDFQIQYKEFGKPNIYTVIGFITDSGYITVVRYKKGEGEWEEFNI